MKLIKLNVGDRFYWKGVKYTVFIKLKKKAPTMSYKIPCITWPMCDRVVSMPSGRQVKPIIRIKGNV